MGTTPAPVRRPSRLRRRILLTLTSLVCALGLAELAARIFWNHARPGHVAGLYVPHATAGFRLAPNFRGVQQADALQAEIATNELGYRHPPLQAKTPSRRRILVLGDSLAFGHLVASEQAFPAVLEQQLRQGGKDVEVINAAVPGSTTHNQFHLLEADVDRVQPDEVVLAFYIGNDFGSNHTAKTGVLVAEWGGLVTHSLHPTVGERIRDTLLAHSRLALLVRHALQPKAVATGSDAVRYVCDQAEWDAAFSLAMIRREWSADAQEAFRQTQLWLQVTADFCRERRLPFRLLLLPGPLQYSDEMWQLAVGYCNLKAADFERDKPDRLLVEWCQQQQIQVLDLLPAFTAATKQKPQERLFLDVHFSPAGHVLAATTIAAGWYP